MTDSSKPSGSDRRRFLRTSLGVGAALGALAATGSAPAIAQSRASRPVVISSRNGYIHTNGGRHEPIEGLIR